MAMTTTVLINRLAGRFDLSRMGQGLNGDLELIPPVLYVEGIRPHDGQVLVMRTQDLPSSSHVRCLYLCVGNKPPSSCSRWMGEVVHVTGLDADLVTVFNEAQGIFTDLYEWERTLGKMVLDGELADMVRVSLPVFGNRITVVDYDLQMLVHCQPDVDGGYNVIDGSDGGDPVPSEIVAMFATKRESSLSSHAPYLVSDEGGNRSYCMNLYSGETYAGSCSIFEEKRAFTEADFELFRVFAGFVQDKIVLSGSLPARSSSSLKEVFTRLLSSFPVSRRDVQRAIELKKMSLAATDIDSYRWFCFVVRSAGRAKVLSDKFFCETIERILPLGTALPFEGSIVVFCQLEPGAHRADVLEGQLRQTLVDLHLEAGVSRTFLDIFHARDYYLQACCAIDTGLDRGEQDVCHMFGANVLEYMLQNSCGGFSSEMVVAPGLVKLARRSEQGVDYIETLRYYLDNECSMTKTARQLFVHRSTLDDRIKRIERFVDLSTPESRLYLRMCLSLEDTSWMNNADVAD